MKLTLIFICIAIIAENVYCTMSEAQVKSAAKLLKNVCLPKSKATNAQVEAMHQGTFTQEKEIMSYMECILRTGQIMKDGKINFDYIRTQLANFPSSISEPALVTIENCKDSVKSSDKFVAAQEFYKCFYEDNPSNFFLP